MDIRQRISELERLSRNTFISGSIVSFNNDTKQAIVSLNFPENKIESEPLPVVGRDTMSAHEPVLVILPSANPSMGYVIALTPDPKLTRLSERINDLEQRLT